MSDNKKEFRSQIRKRGEDIYRDDKVLSSLVSDIFNDDEKLRNTLKVAISADIPVKVLNLKALNSSQQNLEMAKLVKSFSDNYSLKESSAQDAVFILALGLGLIDDYESSHVSVAQNAQIVVSNDSIANDAPKHIKDMLLNNEKEPIKQKTMGLKNEIKTLRNNIREVDTKIREIDRSIQDWHAPLTQTDMENEGFHAHKHGALYGGKGHGQGLYADLKAEEKKKDTLEIRMGDIEDEIKENEDKLREIENDFKVNADERVEDYYNSLIKQMHFAKTKEECTRLAKLFNELKGYRDADIMAKTCTEQPLLIEYGNLLHAKSKAKTQYDFEELAKKFRNMKGFKDSSELAEQCEDNATQTAYDELVKHRADAKTESGFELLAKKFKDMNGYKDSDKLADECRTQAIQAKYDALVLDKARIKTDKEFSDLAVKFKSMKGFGDSDVLAKECEYLAIKANYESLKSAKSTAKTENEFLELAKSFSEIKDFENATDLSKECEDLAMQAKRKSEYDELVEAKSTEKTVAGLRDLAKKFNNFIDFEDAVSMAKDCEIQAQTLLSQYEQLKLEEFKVDDSNSFVELIRKFYEFDEIHGFDDASALADARQNQALKIKYDSLILLMPNAKTEDEFRNLAKEFNNLNFYIKQSNGICQTSYENSHTLARECDEKANMISKWKKEGKCWICGGRIVGIFKKACEICGQISNCRHCGGESGGGLFKNKCKSCNRSI